MRDARHWDETVELAGPWFRAVIDAVDQVHHQPLLADFWREGEPVPNPAQPHPYGHNVPAEWQNRPRSFLLDCDANPPRPWKLDTIIPVWSFAYVRGQAPERSWQLYAFSPQGPRPNVQVTVPGYGAVTIDVSPSGSYYHLAEVGRTVSPIGALR